MASNPKSWGEGIMGTKYFPNMWRNNFYGKWESFQLIPFTTFLQFRKDQRSALMGVVLTRSHP